MSATANSTVSPQSKTRSNSQDTACQTGRQQHLDVEVIVAYNALMPVMKSVPCLLGRWCILVWCIQVRGGSQSPNLALRHSECGGANSYLDLLSESDPHKPPHRPPSPSMQVLPGTDTWQLNVFHYTGKRLYRSGPTSCIYTHRPNSQASSSVLQHHRMHFQASKCLHLGLPHSRELGPQMHGTYPMRAYIGPSSD